MALIKEIHKTEIAVRKQRPPHHPDAPSIRVSGLTVTYDDRVALENISFELPAGERVAVVGPNGAGKSTLFKVIAGVLPYSQGQVSLFGEEPGGHICVAYLPQRSQVDWSFPVSVTDVVMMGRIGKMGMLRWPRRADHEMVNHALSQVGLEKLARRQISQLSGGQQQRMFIARALAQEAELMLMDEPLNGLDVGSQENIFSILDLLKKEGVTVMIATHDLNQAAERFDQVMLLNHHLVGIGRPDQVFTADQLLNAYGGHMRLVQMGGNTLALGDTCCEEDAHE